MSDQVDLDFLEAQFEHLGEPSSIILAQKHLVPGMPWNHLLHKLPVKLGKPLHDLSLGVLAHIFLLAKAFLAGYTSDPLCAGHRHQHTF